MQLEGSIVVVTGANRGIGAEFVRQLQARGVEKIYAGARNPESITATGVIPIRLDVTDPAQIAAAAAEAADATLLINNAGLATGASILGGDLTDIRREFETNVFGPLQTIRAFAPVLAANGGGAILNVASALSWFSYPGSTIYSASKAAVWSLSDGARGELAGQGTQVTTLHMGAVDTDMTAGWAVPKATPESIVTAALDGIEQDATEVLADDTASALKSTLTADPRERYAATGA